jgi:hypothetical protein
MDNELICKHETYFHEGHHRLDSSLELSSKLVYLKRTESTEEFTKERLFELQKSHCDALYEAANIYALSVPTNAGH